MLCHVFNNSVTINNRVIKHYSRCPCFLVTFPIMMKTGPSQLNVWSVKSNQWCRSHRHTESSSGRRSIGDHGKSGTHLAIKPSNEQDPNARMRSRFYPRMLATMCIVHFSTIFDQCPRFRILSHRPIFFLASNSSSRNHSSRFNHPLHSTVKPSTVTYYQQEKSWSRHQL